MTRSKEKLGAFITCGAAAVSLNHDPSDPTSVDSLIEAIKGLMTRKGSCKEVVKEREWTVEHPTMA